MSISRWFKAQYWFLPAAICCVAVGLALLLLATGSSFSPLPRWLATPDASAARDLMSVIAGSLLAATATIFSITIAVIVLTSSLFGARLVRNFMDDRGSQIALGMFLGSFLYALVVLRGIDDGAVPVFAVDVALYLTVIDVGVLVYYINHITNSVQLDTLSDRLRSDFEAVVATAYGEPDCGSNPAPKAQGEYLTTPVRGVKQGYLAQFKPKELLEIACEFGCSIRVSLRVGDAVIPDQRIACLDWSTSPTEDAAAEAAQKVRRALIIKSARTPVQDVSLASHQLRELLVRAMSPGISDTQTAVSAIDNMAPGLAKLAKDPPPPAKLLLADNGKEYVEIPQLTFEDLIDGLFSDLRCFAVTSPDVLHRSLELTKTLAEWADGTEIPAILGRNVADLRTAVEHSDLNPVDLLNFQRAADTTVEQLRTKATESRGHQ